MLEYKPKSLEELFKILDTKRVLIYGEGNFLKKFKKFYPKPLIHLSGIKELLILDYLNPNNLSIGAMCKLSTILEEQRVPKPLQEVLKGSINLNETIGGLICNPEHKFSLLAALYAYNVYINLSSSNGDRYIPINEFYFDDKNILKQNEFLKRIILPLPPLNDYYFVNEKTYSLFVIYNILDGRIKDLRVAVLAGTVYRSKYFENLTIGMDYKTLQARSGELISIFLEEFNIYIKNSKYIDAVALELVLKTALNKIFIF